MGRRVSFTETELRRTMKVAREQDPRSVVEVLPGGIIRIMPEPSVKADRSEVEEWFSNDTD